MNFGPFWPHLFPEARNPAYTLTNANLTRYQGSIEKKCHKKSKKKSLIFLNDLDFLELGKNLKFDLPLSDLIGTNLKYWTILHFWNFPSGKKIISLKQLKLPKIGFGPTWRKMAPNKWKYREIWRFQVFYALIYGFYEKTIENIKMRLKCAKKKWGTELPLIRPGWGRKWTKL